MNEQIPLSRHASGRIRSRSTVDRLTFWRFMTGVCDMEQEPTRSADCDSRLAERIMNKSQAMKPVRAFSALSRVVIPVCKAGEYASAVVTENRSAPRLCHGIVLNSLLVSSTDVTKYSGQTRRACSKSLWASFFINAACGRPLRRAPLRSTQKSPSMIVLLGPMS